VDDLKESFQVEKRQLEEHIGMLEKERFVRRWADSPLAVHLTIYLTVHLCLRKIKEEEGGYTATTTGTDIVPKPRSKRESRLTNPLKQDEFMLTLT